MTPRRPRRSLLAGLLLGWLVPPQHREAVEGDLEELYRRRAARLGARRARLRYLFDLASLTLAARRAAEDWLELEAHRKGDGVMRNLWQDVRFGWRQLRHSPGFTAVAVLTLALGIGANTAIFSVVNGVLLTPLPYPEPDRLVRIFESHPEAGYPRFTVAPANFADWREQARSFEALAAYGGTGATLVGPQGPERLAGLRVSPDIFRVLGVPPALGRPFLPEEEQPGNEQVVLLSDGLWRRRFSADPSIVSQQVTINDRSYTVAGVMPPDFAFPSDQVELWVPLVMGERERANRGGHYLGVIARLKPGVTVAQAHSEMSALARRLAEEYPASSKGDDALVESAQETMVANIRTTLLVLLGAVGFVLLIACANIANLQLARATARSRELAIRAALGAGRGRLVRQFLVESLLLAGLGGACGLALAYWLVELLPVISSGGIPRLDQVRIDGPVLAFTLGVGLLTAVLFGTAPAFHVSRTNVQEALKEGTRGSSSGAGGGLRRSLVVAEVALALVLLIGSGLLLRSFAALQAVDPGFDPAGVVTFSLTLPRPAYDDTRISTFYTRLAERLESLPGIDAVGAAQTLPMAGSYSLSFTIVGRPAPPPGEGPSANYRAVTPGYFRALRVPLRRGRDFTAQDWQQARPVAIVDESFVARHFPDAEPLGQRIDIGNGTDHLYEIIGVVADVRYAGLDAGLRPTMYVLASTDTFSTMAVVVRAEGDTSGVVPAARAAVGELDADVPIFRVRNLEEVVANTISDRRFALLLAVIFAALAMTLAAVGIYGVMAYSVVQRTREIGVRTALGAQPADILRLILGQGMLLATVGLAIGLGLGLWLTRFMETMLFAVERTDALTFAGVTALLAAVALLACYVPARRAMRTDPLTALRHE